MKVLLLYFNTIRYLKFSQIYHRVFRKFKKIVVFKNVTYQILDKSKFFINAVLYDEKISVNFEAKFLGNTKILRFPQDWNDEANSKLWLYNIHYFDDLISENHQSKHQFHLKLLDKWINENPIGQGNGWEPYPSSLRICNIIKAWHFGLELEKHHLDNLYYQASYLSKNLEKHLLGNHYLSNLKALLFAGTFFKNNVWSNTAIKELLYEIDEQILDDGGNFELSPMYHSLCLVDMLDIYNLLNAYHDNESLLSTIKTKILKMLDYMDKMAHPNNELSFFNDSVNGVAPTKNRIEEYAKNLGFNLHRNPLLIDATFFQNSGYMVGIHSGNKLIFDAGSVGPDYIPGHAHADTLSFEFSIGDERVFVNSGISEYGASSKRLDQRKTKSHSTLEINGKDSSQVWHGFRVAKRAKVNEHRCSVSGNKIHFSGTHDGYKNFFSGCYHSRYMKLSKESLIIKDNIRGEFKNAISRLFFHPDLEIKVNDNVIYVSGKHFKMELFLNNLDYNISNSEWHPEFGISIANKCLEIFSIENSISLNIYWKSDK